VFGCRSGDGSAAFSWQHPCQPHQKAKPGNKNPKSLILINIHPPHEFMTQTIQTKPITGLIKNQQWIAENPTPPNKIK
jgi:hypothetical protein